MKRPAANCVSLLFAVAFLAAGRLERACGQSLQAGAAGGATVSTLGGSDVENASWRTSLTAGVQLVWQPASLIGLQTGLLYAGKGASFGEGTLTGFVRPSYIEIPALLRLSPPLPGSYLRPTFLAGVSLGVNTGCKAGVENASTSFEADCEDIEVKKMDLGASVGLSLDYAAGSRLLISPAVRYTRGLTGIDDSADEADVKNTAIEVSVALRMRLIR